jgi:hypothetical protein
MLLHYKHVTVSFTMRMVESEKNFFNIRNTFLHNLCLFLMSYNYIKKLILKNKIIKITKAHDPSYGLGNLT